jgi:hypothetical protein
VFCFVVHFWQFSVSYDKEILVTLPDRESCSARQELITEDLCLEDIVGHVPGFEAVAADSSIGASEVALVSRVGPESRRPLKRTLAIAGLVVVLTASAPLRI